VSDEEHYYTVKEFLAELRKRGVKFSERTIRHWINEGKIDAIRPGQRHWYIPERELEKLLQGPPDSGLTLYAAGRQLRTA